jgi:hypothetical protein
MEFRGLEALPNLHGGPRLRLGRAFEQAQYAILLGLLSHARNAANASSRII